MLYILFFFGYMRYLSYPSLAFLGTFIVHTLPVLRMYNLINSPVNFLYSDLCRYIIQRLLIFIGIIHPFYSFSLCKDCFLYCVYIASFCLYQSPCV
jgi:hypothetical protein